MPVKPACVSSRAFFTFVGTLCESGQIPRNTTTSVGQSRNLAGSAQSTNEGVRILQIAAPSAGCGSVLSTLSNRWQAIMTMQMEMSIAFGAGTQLISTWDRRPLTWIRPPSPEFARHEVTATQGTAQPSHARQPNAVALT